MLPLVSVAMVALGTFASGLTDAVAIALIVVGAGMFFIGMLLPLLTEFQIGPGGFSAKLRERDQEIQATLDPEYESLARAAADLAGDPAAGKELLDRALVETYLRWHDAKREGAVKLVQGQLEGLTGGSSGVAPTTAKGPW